MDASTISDRGATTRSSKRTPIDDSRAARKRRCNTEAHTSDESIATVENTDSLSTLETNSQTPYPESARARCIALLELHEQILTHLPERQLLEVKQVSKGWKKVIDESPTLQRKLFFRADDKIVGQRVWIVSNKTNTLESSIMDAGQFSETSMRRPYIFNPLLFQEAQDTTTWANDIVSRAKRPHGSLAFKFTPDLNAAALGKQSSCRAMFLTQPPTTEIEVCWHYNRFRPRKAGTRGLTYSARYSQTTRLSNANGVTIGQLLDTAATDFTPWCVLIDGSLVRIQNAVFPTLEERAAVEGVTIYKHQKKTKKKNEKTKSKTPRMSAPSLSSIFSSANGH